MPNPPTVIAARDRTGEALAGRGGAPLVLLAVGDPAAAEPLPTLLRLSGYRTTTARTGAEAPARVRECRFDLVILDVLLDRARRQASGPRRHRRDGHPGRPAPGRRRPARVRVPAHAVLRRRTRPAAHRPRLGAPQGLVVLGDEIFTVETEHRRLRAVSLTTGESRIDAEDLPVGPPPGSVPRTQPALLAGGMPGTPYRSAGLAVAPDDTLLLAANGEGTVLRLSPAGSGD